MMVNSFLLNLESYWDDFGSAIVIMGHCMSDLGIWSAHLSYTTHSEYFPTVVPDQFMVCTHLKKK